MVARMPQVHNRKDLKRSGAKGTNAGGGAGQLGAVSLSPYHQGSQGG